MAASYPASAKNFASINDGDTVAASMWTDAYDEITALEQALVSGGLAHNLTPDSSDNARTLGSTSKAWGLAYLTGLNLSAATTLTIASGAVTATQGYHAVDTESAAASDDLDTITAGTGVQEGFLLVLRAANTSHVVTAKDGSGNLLLNGDYALNATDRTLLLIYDGTNWRELARSGAASGITTSGSTVTQIAFAGTQSASSNANTLDDYEEGTFTPGVSFGGGTTGITYTTQSGHYVKVGKNVWFTASIVLSAKGSSSGSAKLTGLPFAEGDNLNRAVTVVPNANFTGLTGSLVGLVDNSGTSVALQQTSSTGASAITESNFTGTTVFYVSGWYRAAN